MITNPFGFFKTDDKLRHLFDLNWSLISKTLNQSVYCAFQGIQVAKKGHGVWKILIWSWKILIFPQLLILLEFCETGKQKSSYREIL